MPCLAHGQFIPFHGWVTGVDFTDAPPYDTAACSTLYTPPHGTTRHLGYGPLQGCS